MCKVTAYMAMPLLLVNIGIQKKTTLEQVARDDKLKLQNTKVN